MPSQPTPEQRLILLMTGLRQSKEAIEEAEGLLSKENPPINYDELFRSAAQNGVTSILYKNSLKLHGLPDGFRARLKYSYYGALRKNAMHLQETLNVSRALREGGVDVVILKGSLASDILFKDPGLYPTGDIDLLIRPSEVHNATGRLLSLGYKMADETEQPEHGDCANFFNEVYSIDLQWNLVEPYFNIPNDFWWADSRKIMKDNEQLTILSAEKYLLFAISHLFSHGFTTLKFFSLIDAVMNTYKDEIDWTELINYSEEFGMGGLVFFTVSLLHEMLGVEVPEQLTRRRRPGYGICRKAVLSGLFKKTTLFYMRIAVYLLLLAGPSALFRVTRKAIFPNPARLRARYGLPEHSKLIYIYYVLNPFLIFFGKI
jgi:Uncharacterised nucleotidyltransferase